MKFVMALTVLGVVLASGCINANIVSNEDLNRFGNSENCGEIGQDCCTWVGTGDFGEVTARAYCNGGLECRASQCVEGPDYGSAGRP